MVLYAFALPLSEECGRFELLGMPPKNRLFLNYPSWPAKTLVDLHVARGKGQKHDRDAKLQLAVHLHPLPRKIHSNAFILLPARSFLGSSTQRPGTRQHHSDDGTGAQTYGCCDKRSTRDHVFKFNVLWPV